MVKNRRAALSPEVDRQLLAEERRHIAQYAWEGSFFIIALAACIAVIARALRAEAHVIEQQESFLALVSHQFKTPLASLQLSLETMAMRPLSPEHMRALIERMLADVGAHGEHGDADPGEHAAGSRPDRSAARSRWTWPPRSRE